MGANNFFTWGGGDSLRAKKLSTRDRLELLESRIDFIQSNQTEALRELYSRINVIIEHLGYDHFDSGPRLSKYRQDDDPQGCASP